MHHETSSVCLVVKDEFIFEQLDLKSNCKILLTGQKLIIYKFNRFNNTMNWRYSYNTDGITFSCNKTIKLTGVGMYGSHEGKIQSGILKIYEVEHLPILFMKNH